MFQNNKYRTWYFSIIDSAKSQQQNRNKKTGYFERHHIYPKSLYPDLATEENNLLLLTAKEHFICHLLLCKFTQGKAKSKMINALIRMQYSHSDNQKRYTSNSYDTIRSLIAEKNSFEFKGKPKSEEHKKAISEGSKGKKMPQSYREQFTKRSKQMWKDGVFDNRPKHSDQTKAKLRKAQTGKKLSKETREKISVANIGRVVSEEQKAKFSKSFVGKYQWIKNPETREFSFVDKDTANKYLSAGWIKGKYQKNAKCIKLAPETFQK